VKVTLEVNSQEVRLTLSRFMSKVFLALNRQIKLVIYEWKLGRCHFAFYILNDDDLQPSEETTDELSWN